MSQQQEKELFSIEIGLVDWTDNLRYPPCTLATGYLVNGRG